LAAALTVPLAASAQLVTGVTQILDATGDGTNAVDGPALVGVRPDGTAYVAALASHNVFRIDPSGTVTELLDESGAGTGSPLTNPSAIAVAPLGKVYVANVSSSVLFQIDPSGAVAIFMTYWTGDEDAPMYGPNGLAVHSDGKVFVAAGASDNAFRVTPSGVASEILDATGDGAGNPASIPEAVVVDKHGNAYVAARGSDNVFRITPGGEVTEILDATGDGAGHPLERPTDLALDGQGNLYVTGLTSDNLFRVASDGAVAWLGDFSGIEDVVVDKQDQVFVSLQGSDEVVLLTPAGQVVPILGPAGAGPGQPLDGPRELAVDDAGRVYVTAFDSDNVLRVDVARPCSNGLDDDGDGLADFPSDPGCADANAIEHPACDDGLDNDGDGKIDWDGGPGAGTPDPQCTQAWRGRESASSCGLGFEVLLVLAPWAAWRRARRRG
jgi:streptogramin lyase